MNEVLHINDDVLESQASFPTHYRGLSSGLATVYYEKCVIYKESGERRESSLSF